MAEWKKIQISRFLKEREGRYAPDDKAVRGLKRLNKIDFSGEIHLSDKSSKTDMIIVEPGDLVISGINVSKGALAVYKGEEPIAATIHYSSYIFDESQINIDYFKRFVKSQAFVQTLKDQVKGGIKTEIKPKHFLPLEIHLPDIKSQKEIVSFFKRIENEMDDLIGEIEHQESFIKQLRRQVLQEAVEGKLTAGWRKEHPGLISGENHASKLLEKIKGEKERLVKEGRIRKDKLFPPITDEEKSFDLPDGWVWCRLGDVINLVSGQHIEATDCNLNKQGVPYITGPADFGILHPIVSKWTTKPKVFSWYGEILITVKGSGVGKLNINDQDRLVISRQLMAIQNIMINNQYGFYWLQTLYMALQGIKEGLIPGITRDDIQYKIFSLPPLAEQQAIVERVDKLMAMIGELEKQVSERKEQSAMLSQSVLREAISAGRKI